MAAWQAMLQVRNHSKACPERVVTVGGGAHRTFGMAAPPHPLSHTAGSAGSPVLKSTFGWKMGVTKDTLGGASGYVEGHLMLSSKIPLSYGVPDGPRSCAFQVKMSDSSVRASWMSGSGFPFDISLNSFSSRWFTMVPARAALAATVPPPGTPFLYCTGVSFPH
eukprot:scaffold869_cov105-Isochrysis_galbana.AAC.50